MTTPVGVLEIVELTGAGGRATVTSWVTRHDTFPPPRWYVGGVAARRLDEVLDWLKVTDRWPTRGMVVVMRWAQEHSADGEIADSQLKPHMADALLDAKWLRHKRPPDTLEVTRLGRAVATRAIDVHDPVTRLPEAEWQELRRDLAEMAMAPAPPAGRR